MRYLHYRELARTHHAQLLTVAARRHATFTHQTNGFRPPHGSALTKFAHPYQKARESPIIPVKDSHAALHDGEGNTAACSRCRSVSWQWVLILSRQGALRALLRRGAWSASS